eukprot:g3954.t1
MKHTTAPYYLGTSDFVSMCKNDLIRIKSVFVMYDNDGIGAIMSDQIVSMRNHCLKRLPSSHILRTILLELIPNVILEKCREISEDPSILYFQDFLLILKHEFELKEPHLKHSLSKSSSKSSTSSSQSLEDNNSQNHHGASEDKTSESKVSSHGRISSCSVHDGSSVKSATERCSVFNEDMTTTRKQQSFYGRPPVLVGRQVSSETLIAHQSSIPDVAIRPKSISVYQEHLLGDRPCTKSTCSKPNCILISNKYERQNSQDSTLAQKAPSTGTGGHNREISHFTTDKIELKTSATCYNNNNNNCKTHPKNKN